jgi:hypothetical protein
MTEPYLTVAEITAKYPNEWVFLANPKLDRGNHVLGGYVVLHAPTRAEYYRLIDQWDDPNVNHTASFYTGQWDVESELPIEESGAA